MTTTSTAPALSQIELHRASATFADGGEVYLTEEETNLLRIGRNSPRLDSEYNYVVVGPHRCSRGFGHVMMPDSIAEMGEDGEERNTHTYDRIAFIERAIDQLERAKALLLAKAADR